MTNYKYTKNDDFILNIEEQKIIVDWTKSNYLRLNDNGGLKNKYMKSMDEIPDIPDVVWKIKERIIEKEFLDDAKQEPRFKDSIGYMIEGGQLHEHTDQNIEDLIHTRFNVYVQIPKEGGLPIYNNKLCSLKERTYICCRAGIDKHYSQMVIGERERIVLSYGFLLPYERIKNIVYEY